MRIGMLHYEFLGRDKCFSLALKFSLLPGVFLLEVGFLGEGRI
jgi:hypothetical protein